MNCGIYATELAHVQSKEILTASKEAECHFRARIESIVEGIPDLDVPSVLLRIWMI